MGRMKGKVGNKMKSRGKKDNQRMGERKEGEGNKENHKKDKEKLEKKERKEWRKPDEISKILLKANHGHITDTGAKTENLFLLNFQ